MTTSTAAIEFPRYAETLADVIRIAKLIARDILTSGGRASVLHGGHESAASLRWWLEYTAPGNEALNMDNDLTARVALETARVEIAEITGEWIVFPRERRISAAIDGTAVLLEE